MYRIEFVFLADKKIANKLLECLTSLMEIIAGEAFQGAVLVEEKGDDEDEKEG